MHPLPKTTCGYRDYTVIMKCNVVYGQTMQAYGRSKGTDPLIVILGFRCWWTSTPPPSPSARKIILTIYWTGRWVGSTIGLDVLKKEIFYILLLSAIEAWFLGCSVRSLVTVPTELSRLTLLGLLNLLLRLGFRSMKANILVKWRTLLLRVSKVRVSSPSHGLAFLTNKFTFLLSL